MNKQEEKIVAKEFLDIFKYITYSKHDIKDSLKNPAIKSFYMVLKNMQKKELEEENLYDYFLNHEPLLFGALIEKNAFSDKYSEELKWIKNNINFQDKYKTLQIYYSVENRIKEMKSSSSYLFYKKEIEDETKKDIIELLLNSNISKEDIEKIYKKDKKNFNECLKENFIDFLKIDKLDSYYQLLKIKEDNLPNNYIKKRNNGNYDKFWISAVELPNLKLIIKKGFEFNDKENFFNNKSLLENVLESTMHKEIRLLILNNLNNSENQNYNHQLKIINNFLEDKNNNNDEIIDVIKLLKIKIQNELILSKIAVNNIENKVNNIGNKI